MTRVPVPLKPTAGFCIKSSSLQPSGRKIFINIAWDPNVPAPPEGNEDAIQRAMLGEDDSDQLNPDAWFVPVVVSDAKQDMDKAGNPSLVFDCIYHSSIRSRSARDPAFKTFIQGALILIFLALQRIEAQTSLVLSRQISTPNIASKGKLLPRTVLIPSFLSSSPPIAQKKPLIEEVASNSSKSDASTKGILKPTTAASTPKLPVQKPKPGTAPLRPTWSWSSADSGSIEITITVPLLTHALVSQTTLDLEARRLLLSVPSYAPLDINLDMSDAEIVATSAGVADSGHAALMLKRERALDVDGALAEWRVADGALVLIA
ncbi:PIH1 family [Mycena sp. CBHHK59/15]|nr:PIH1 family [Mycena sp. CBHHK59/15]